MIEAQLIGHSHVFAVRDALALQPPLARERVEAIQVLHVVKRPERVMSVADDGKPQLHPALLAVLDRPDTAEAQVFSLIGGSVPFYFGLFEHRQPYDFILPDQPHLACSPGTELLPYSYCAKAMLRMLEEHTLTLSALRERIAGPLIHLESPPPIGDSAYCEAKLPPAFSGPAYQGMRVAAPVFRYKVWRLHSALMRQHCERIDVRFMACPAESMDEQGFLKPIYWPTNEPLHGNALYGALVLDQVEGLLNSGARRAEVVQ